MFRRNKKTRKYQTPCAAVTDMVLESNFCNTIVRFNVQSKDLENMNDPDSDSFDDTEGFYFES